MATHRIRMARMLPLLGILTLLALLVNADPSVDGRSEQTVFATTKSPKRVAIVGAGAAGTSAAFFLRRAARVAEERAGAEPGEFLGVIDVFDKEDYVGGRSTVVYPHSDPKLQAVELGASIFVGANENLVKAAKLFNLTTADPGFAEAGIGIWDGSQFLFTTTTTKSRWSGWWDTIAALRRYGPLSPYRQNKAVNALLTKFKHLYDSAWLAQRGTVSSIEEFAATLELGAELTSRTGLDWAKNEVGVNDRWASEIIEGSTRVNYARDLDQIHALGAGVSLATGEATSIEGGNRRLFSSMVKDSGANVHLNTVVTEIKVLDEGDDVPSFRVLTNVSDNTYDQVFFAAPWHHSPISKHLANSFVNPIPDQEYVTLHVTLLATTAPTPHPSFFGLPPNTAIPTTVITSAAAYRADPDAVHPAFQSITYHGETSEGSGEYVVKLFSLSEIDDYTLTTIFGSEPTWVYRKVWQSYPALAPIATYAPVEPVPGLHYLAALEPWVSTMETQTLSAREAVARVAQRWWGIGPGECREGKGWDLTCAEV